MAVKNIKTLAHFIANCSEIETKPDHTLFFRGHADKEYKPLPTIFRHQDNDVKNEKFIEREDELFHNLITQCPDDFNNCVSTFDYLVKMQHYGLPTRLLDITNNPLVALYFACSSLYPNKVQDRTAKDAQILIYQVPNEEIKYYNSDTVSVISNLAKVKSDFNFANENQKRRFIHNIEAEKPYFQDKIEFSDLQKVICVKPKLDNKRIIKQSGAFFLFGMGEHKTDSKLISEKYRPSIKHINIPKNSKLDLLKELEMLSISKATLFPEIDQVAQFLQSELKTKTNKVKTNKNLLFEKLGNFETKPYDTNFFAISTGHKVAEEKATDLDKDSKKFAKLLVNVISTNDLVMEQLKTNGKEQALLGDFSEVFMDAVIENMVKFESVANKVLSNDKFAKRIKMVVFDLLKLKIDASS